MKPLKFVQTRKRYWHEWILTLKMKTMCLHPFVSSILPVRVEGGTWPWPSSVCEEDAVRESANVSLMCPRLSGWVLTVTRTLDSSLCKKGVFRKSTQVPNYTSDFYPRIVIKNMFTALIVCIFSFRVNPLKGSLIPCSTVLTKCFHIFSQLDSLFHFWKILCNYFLMSWKPHKVPSAMVTSTLFSQIKFHLIFSFYLIN